MLSTVLEKVDWSEVEGVPGLVFSRAGHLQSPLIGHPALAPRVILGGKAVSAVGPVSFMVAYRRHIWHLGD